MSEPSISAEPLIVHMSEPFNAEPRTPSLRAAFFTPQDRFYVRTHGTVPQLDARHRITVGGRVEEPMALDLAQLQARFEPVGQAATMQCAGNRRADLHRIRPVSGSPWGPGAIGTADWTGIPLARLLHAAGADTDPTLHVAFESADTCRADGQDFAYGVSIPMHKAMSDEVLVAWALNGEALTAAHGAPLRMVVPGYAGVRSPKWLRSITVQDRPSDNPMQADDYKLFPPDATAATDPALGMTINAMPLNSAICEPEPDARLAAGPVTLRGYATASNRAVVRIDVSADGGRNWTQARLDPNPNQPWTWWFWQAELHLRPGPHELTVRAWDDAGQTQPDRPEDTWNYKGYLSAAWHRVPVVVA